MYFKDAIKNYVPYDDQEKQDKKVMLDYINMFDNILTRENEFGHMTSSAWVVNKDRTKVLMAYHNIYKSYSWLGGHADGEEDLLSVAIRETKEEAGVNNVIPIMEDIFSLEILPVISHVKRGKNISSHEHLNVTYLLEVSEDEELHIKEDENSNVKWIDIDKAVETSTEETMKPVYEKLIKKLKEI